MCLTVSKKLNICVKKCFKVLEEDLDGDFRTPYRHHPVPENGWLVPYTKSRKRVWKKGDQIHGAFIHAYLDEDGDFWLDNSEELHNAYAIQVEAKGSNDIVCRALYIPDADKTTNREATVKFLERRRGVHEIAKRFPHLRKYLVL